MKGATTMYTIYDVKLNSRTFNFGGLEWVVDGEIGRMVYPGTWAECVVRTYYSNGWGSDHNWEVGTPMV